MKKDIAKRFAANPLLSPKDLKPSIKGLEITCLLNPGAFRYEGKTWLLVRVAERPVQKENLISFPIIKPNGDYEIIEIATNDPALKNSDPRVINYKGADYLTTLSHLRLLCSEDGIHFYDPESYPLLTGKGKLEAFGIEDCRVSQIDNKYYLTFTAVSGNGVGVGLKITSDWKNFASHGMIFPPHNKDCAIFEEKINNKFYAFHRPSSPEIGGNYIWIAESPDGIHWGNHQCILRTRQDNWDSARVGAGAAPIKTDKGLLAIYHGANKQHQYCLGAILLDANDPAKLLAQTDAPIMIPTEEYETKGFLGNVVFTNGHILKEDSDTVTVYYGAADEYVCAADFSIKEILSLLIPCHAN
ncbi:glycoside hydrolase family 130 protein [Ferruginibacter albus]|uniref:glycoside hydrolase family 130 protein n=1 Tax=Ferruginibacter albus TaxID=2875540 RepID=UPI001CC5702B|nr:glycoside hydrolase family 130 protein [Ferruginibacter albus]UAY53608.1 glycoside hydrolase family 130 protein [Ferruginibacter albus]